MLSEKSYENFRTVLAMNLCKFLQSDQLKAVLETIDITMADYEISKKSVEIIHETGFPEVAKCFLASKAISNLSQGTLNLYRYKLVHFFNTVKKSYTDVTANDIRVYLYNFKIEHNAADSYVDCIRVTLHNFFQWLVNNDYLNKNPCAKVEKIKFQQKNREPLTQIQLESIRWHADDVRSKAVIDFFYSTGCRVSECADICLSDIDWSNRSVRIRHGKGNKERIVYFNAESELTLKEYIKSRTDDTDALFVSTKAPHQRLQPRALENIVKQAGKKAGIHAYPHKLRHTFATVGLRNGIPLDKLQVLMGHTNPKTTLIYASHDMTQICIEHSKAFS